MSIEVICDGCKNKLRFNCPYFSVIATSSKTIKNYEEENELPLRVEKRFCVDCLFDSSSSKTNKPKGHIEFSRFIEYRFSEGYNIITIIRKNHPNEVIANTIDEDEDD